MATSAPSQTPAATFAARGGGGGGGLDTHDIALYVDDLLFVSPDLNEIQRIKGDLKSEYGIMDLGEARSR